MLIYGHGLLADSPTPLGGWESALPKSQRARLSLVAAKSYSKGIVKITYEPATDP